MTRRQIVKRATLFAFGIALTKLDLLKASEGEGTGKGQLTCDLNQWSTIVFKYNGKAITVPVSEVFSALSS